MKLVWFFSLYFFLLKYFIEKFTKTTLDWSYSYRVIVGVIMFNYFIFTINFNFTQPSNKSNRYVGIILYIMNWKLYIIYLSSWFGVYNCTKEHEPWKWLKLQQGKRSEEQNHIKRTPLETTLNSAWEKEARRQIGTVKSTVNVCVYSSQSWLQRSMPSILSSTSEYNCLSFSMLSSEVSQ